MESATAALKLLELCQRRYVGEIVRQFGEIT
jgi:hypothetical protein